MTRFPPKSLCVLSSHWNSKASCHRIWSAYKYKEIIVLLLRPCLRSLLFSSIKAFQESSLLCSLYPLNAYCWQQSSTPATTESMFYSDTPEIYRTCYSSPTPRFPKLVFYSKLRLCDHHRRSATFTDTLYFLRQQQVDAEQELIRLSNTEPTELKDLPMRIPKESARYHFFLYKHSHEGDYLESTGE